MKKSGVLKVDGQAVIGGCMVKGPKKYAVAIKKYNGNILLDEVKYKPAAERMPIFNLFILRGAASFFETLFLGFKALVFSGEYFDSEEKSVQDSVVASRNEEKNIDARKAKEEQQNGIAFAGSVILLILSVIIFFFVPTCAANLFYNNVDLDQRLWFNIVEGIIRIVLFLGYVGLISMIKDMEGVFEYIGAEHKVLNCFESGEEMTVENIQTHSRFRIQSKLSIAFLTLVICSVVFFFIEPKYVLFAVLMRVILFPLIVGISYEITELLGKIKGTAGNILAMPWMWFQCFSAKEPDDLEVIITATAFNAAMDDVNR